LHLAVLGRTDLERGGVPVDAVLTQPKRLALLAYLVLARRGSFQRRDHLLGVFWPSSRPDRARANLRQAIRFLRKSLGEEVLVGRGDGELAIEPGLLACDALDFRAALEGGDPALALELYRGELLPGFFVGGAPDFERWLSRERRELREAARDAARGLSDAAESEGRVKDTIEWARRTVELDPLDEASTRRLMGLLDAQGQRAEALSVYEELRRRLIAELELSPAPETEAAMAELRGRGTSGRVDSKAPSPALDPRRVAVLPYRNRTGDSKHDVVGTMAADWIARGLARNPDLSVVPPTVSRGARDRAGPLPGDDPSLDGPPDYPLTSLADELAAGTVLTGSVELRGEELVFRTTIFDAAERRLLPPPGPVVGPGTEPLRELAHLSDSVAGALAPLLSTRSGHAQQAERPPSFEAYRAYLRGLDLFVAQDWAGSLEEFREASADQDYALPRIVSAIALWNLGQLTEAREVADQARALRASVGPFERGALDMVLGWLGGDWRAAYGGARRQAELAPGSLPAVQVAEEARRLNRPTEARDILTRLNPLQGELRGWIFYWVELCTAHHMLGDHVAELVASRRAVSLHPGHGLATLLEVQALAALGELEELSDRGHQVLATPWGGSPSPGAILRRIALELAAHGHAREGRRYLEMAEEWWSEGPRSQNPVHSRERALTLYHLGRLDEARELLLAASRRGRSDGAPPALDEHHGHLRGHLDEGYLALIAARLGDTEAADRWHAYLQDLDEPFLYGGKWLSLAALSALAGELDRGVSQLRRALIHGLPFNLSLHTNPDLDPLGEHPGFRGVMAAKG
jgi:DNA-binding SARP family transcriptional activator